MNAFFQYIKNPFQPENQERFTLNTFLKTMGLSFVLVFLASIFTVTLMKVGLLPAYWTPTKEINSVLLLFAATVLVPLIEEILFRLNLRISKFNIALFLSLLITVIVKIVFLRGIQISIYIGAIPIFGLIYFIIDRANLPMLKIETFWKSHFKFIFHFAAITFGMLHLTNFETIKWWMIAISPLLAAPYITMGYIFGYIRMKHGFVYGWLIHATVNSFAAINTIHKGFLIVLGHAVVLIAINYFIEKKKKRMEI
jgi:membrane protease YdiL (CAAX protease family)